MIGIRITQKQKWYMLIAIAITVTSTITTLYFWPHWLTIGHGTMAGLWAGTGMSIAELWLRGG